jgi:hypothetical protein
LLHFDLEVTSPHGGRCSSWSLSQTSSACKRSRIPHEERWTDFLQSVTGPLLQNYHRILINEQMKLRYLQFTFGHLPILRSQFHSAVQIPNFSKKMLVQKLINILVEQFILMYWLRIVEAKGTKR